jgi:UDP-3-O-[3-hydroxymyristoyl] glucosamine N-acyltransferase
LREALHTRPAEAGVALGTVVHSKVIVSPRASVGAGTAIMAGAIIGTEAFLGQGVIVNCGGVIDHHCKVADFGHLGVNASMAGGSVLGRGAWIQASSALGYNVELAPYEVLRPGQALEAEAN